jgi:hypothetical protein
LLIKINIDVLRVIPPYLCLSSRAGKINPFVATVAKDSLLTHPRNNNTVNPVFIVFVGGLKKKQWIREQ